MATTWLRSPTASDSGPEPTLGRTHVTATCTIEVATLQSAFRRFNHIDALGALHISLRQVAAIVTCPNKGRSGVSLVGVHGGVEKSLCGLDATSSLIHCPPSISMSGDRRRMQ